MSWLAQPVEQPTAITVLNLAELHGSSLGEHMSPPQRQRLHGAVIIKIISSRDHQRVLIDHKVRHRKAKRISGAPRLTIRIAIHLT